MKRTPITLVGVPLALRTLVERFNPAVLDERQLGARVRLCVLGRGEWDLTIADRQPRLARAAGGADATISATAHTWRRVASDIRYAMDAYSAGRLSMRRDIHVAVGFLAATSSEDRAGRISFRRIETSGAELSVIDAGEGPAIVALHGLGATKSSFLPTMSALAEPFRVIAVDLPGFGDSDKPLRADYDAPFFAAAIAELLDALKLPKAHLLGNSLGGRVALELAMRQPERVESLGLLAPSLAWRRRRLFYPLVRVTRPELGLLQPAPRVAVDRFMRSVITESGEGWRAVGVDEFLRSFTTPAGRHAFYASARQIYLDRPHGADGFWTRLGGVQPDVLCVWGVNDRLVPAAFARHVRAALPDSEHLELDCGHVPQVERAERTNAALAEFFGRERFAGPAEPYAGGRFKRGATDPAGRGVRAA